MSSKQVHSKDTAEETLADDENHPLMTRVVQYDVIRARRQGLKSVGPVSLGTRGRR